MEDTIARIVERFGLRPHPEGGYFTEVYRSEMTVRHPAVADGGDPTRRAGTLIYYLLSGEQFSAFHRVKWTDEIWHLYAGGPLELHVIDADGRHVRNTLTGDVFAGRPTVVVKAGEWQAARLAPGAGWAFGGCTVAPGFEFEDFEMPPADALIAKHPQHAALFRQLARQG